MQQSTFKWDKYAKIEIVFFAFIWLIVPMISDFEYVLKEPPTPYNDPWAVAVIRRLAFGFLGVIPFYLFYKLSIQRWLVKKQYWRFLLSLLVFVVVLDLYTVYVEYALIAKMEFLPGKITSDAKRWKQSQQLYHFTINYLILQLCQIIALAFYIDHEKQTRRMQELQQAQIQADLQYLKAQMQPHFFFNTLNNIYSLALQKSDLTAPLTAKLAGMMRYVLYENGRSAPTLQQEIEFLQHYMDVQSIRYNNAVRIQMDIQVANGEIQVEPLLLFPFIENAFKHGIEEETAAGFVEAVILLSGKELTFSVKNSKAAKTMAHQTGIGLENTRKRLQLIYPSKHLLLVNDEDKAFSILLTIQLS